MQETFWVWTLSLQDEQFTVGNFFFSSMLIYFVRFDTASPQILTVCSSPSLEALCPTFLLWLSKCKDYVCHVCISCIYI